MKVAFIIDSSASISKELAARENVYLANMHVTLDNTAYNNTSDDGLMKEFYSKLMSADVLPMTSQPEPAVYVRMFQEIIDENYDAVFCITLSSAISGSFNSCQMIAKEFEDQVKVFMIDSKGTSFLMEKMLEIGIKLSEEGYDLEYIREKLEWFAQEGKIYVVFDSLEGLVKGGRLSSVSAYIGAALKIKPIVYFNQEGSLEVFEKVRTTKKVYKRWLELVDQALAKYPDGVDIAFAHGDAEDQALLVKAMIQDKYPDIQFRIGYLTPVLGSHACKGALGMGILPKIVD